MLRAIAVTHAVIWYIFGDSRLSITARDAIALYGSQLALIIISGMGVSPVSIPRDLQLHLPARPRINKPRTAINSNPITPAKGFLFTPVTQSGTCPEYLIKFPTLII